MADDLYVPFREAEVGYSTYIFVTPDQAEAILAAEEGEKIKLDDTRWIRLERSAEPKLGRRVYHYYHGEPGGYGYVQAAEDELRRGLTRALAGSDD